MNRSMWKKVLSVRAEHGSWWCWINVVLQPPQLSAAQSLQGRAILLLTSSTPPSCQCSFPQGKRIHAILEVLPCRCQWVFFHIRPEETKSQHSQQPELLLPSCQQAFYSAGPRRIKALHLQSSYCTTHGDSWSRGRGQTYTCRPAELHLREGGNSSLNETCQTGQNPRL